MSFKTTWGNLRSAERRLVIGVAVLLFIVANLVWVRPRFADWGKTKERLETARGKLEKYEKEIREAEKVKSKIAELERTGGGVQQEDQANNFSRAILQQAFQSGVEIKGTAKQQLRTNEFFVELIQSISVQSREENLVDFLYNLGSGDSMIRVRDLPLRPDAAHQYLSGNIKFVASYQKTQKKGRESKPAATTQSAPKPEPKPATPKKS
jgi:Tfp pilus assembly protein PilO